MENMENVLEIINVSKVFGSLVANNKINMTVKKGTVHSIIGENGAGKSTLMNIIAGIYKPDGGEIKVKGKTVHFKNPNNASDCGIGMVHQEFMLFDDLTVLDNVMMGRERTKTGIFIDKKKTRAEIQEICDKYNFNIPLDSVVKDLPVAILQQVEIVKVLYRGADIIILDEPTAVLTPQGIEGLFNALRFLISKGKTIILITHKLGEVMEISDYITVLKDGQVTGNVLPSEVDEEKLAGLMVGREVLLNAQHIEKEIGDEVLKVTDLVVQDKDGIERVKGLNLTVHAGEVVGIAGVAGSGQKELVEALYGLNPPVAGSITYKGEDITHASCRDHRCKGIGYVPQDRLGAGANRESSIWENCIMGYHVAHGFKNKLLLDRKEAGEFTGEVIKDFAVKTPSQESKVRTLSGGNVQKMIVGREFLQKNDLLIIEDPTRGIDIGAIEFIWQKILQLAAQGVAVLLVSHELNEVMELSDRIEVIYDGKLTYAGAYRELTEQQIGLLMMGGKAVDKTQIKKD